MLLKRSGDSAVKKLIVEDINSYLAVDALHTLCRETGYFCYSPRDAVELALSLSWAETVQFIESGCLKSVRCLSTVLNTFANAVDLALRDTYIFNIDLDELKKKLALVTKTVLNHENAAKQEKLSATLNHSTLL